MKKITAEQLRENYKRFACDSIRTLDIEYSLAKNQLEKVEILGQMHTMFLILSNWFGELFHSNDIEAILKKHQVNYEKLKMGEQL